MQRHIYAFCSFFMKIVRQKVINFFRKKGPSGHDKLIFCLSNKKELQRKCFPVNIIKFLITALW